MNRPTAEDLISWLELQKNEVEGGYFASTYQSQVSIGDSSLPGFPSTGNGRFLCSAIYYLIDNTGPSVMHKVTGDMIYHFYTGDAVQMLLLYPRGYPVKYEVMSLGNGIGTGTVPMKVIPGGTWLGSRMLPGGNYALMGVTMSPAFHIADYVIGKRETLISSYPEAGPLIEKLTHE